MQIDCIHELDLGDADEAAIAALLFASFGADFDGRTYHQQRHHLRFVARGPGIVGHMALTYRSVRLGDSLIPVLGLAEVATDPARRGQGSEADLLQSVIAYARTTPADFLLLFGDARLYAAAGFRAAANVTRFVDLKGPRTVGLIERPAQGLMVLALKPGRVWDETAPLDLLGHSF